MNNRITIAPPVMLKARNRYAEPGLRPVLSISSRMLHPRR